MADTPPAPLPPGVSFAKQQAHDRINRVEAVAVGLFVIGGLLLVGGVIHVLAGGSLLVFLSGGLVLLGGCIESLRAEVLKLRASLDKD